jgi:cytochrome c oxidase assembly protein subunit 15
MKEESRTILKSVNPWLHRFAVLTACATFCLVIAGGLVTSTGSGLAVPDWPLSYGQLMPPMIGGIFYEHGHRMVATFVGFLTTILALWLWRVEERRWVRNLGFIALLAVIAQGVLGGLTVLFLLPTPISVSHATLAQSFFSITVVMALVTSPGWAAQQQTELVLAATTRRWVAGTTVAIFLQLVLGALMRHTGSGLAIPDFPLTYGRLLPPTDPGQLQAINDYRLQLDLQPVELSQIWIHFAHRVGAMIVLVASTFAVRHILNNYRADARLREPAIVLMVLLIVQIMLGALTVWGGKGIEIATAHVAAGALLLATSVFLTVRTYHLYAVPETVHAYSLVVEGGKL